MNGSSQYKRKRGSSPIADNIDRPNKQHCLAMNSGNDSAGNSTPDSRLITDDALIMEESVLVDDIGADRMLPADTAEWQATVERVIPNVVSIRFCQTCSFDTDGALTSEATGFVVDAERG